MHFKAHFSLVLLLLATFCYKDAVARGAITKPGTTGDAIRRLFNNEDELTDAEFAKQLVQLKALLATLDPSLESPTIVGGAVGAGAGVGAAAPLALAGSQDDLDFDEDSVAQFGGKPDCNDAALSNEESENDENFDDPEDGRQTSILRRNNRARQNQNRRRQALRRANAQRRRRQAAKRRAQSKRTAERNRARNSQMRRIRQESINRKRRRNLNRRAGNGPRNVARRVIA